MILWNNLFQQIFCCLDLLRSRRRCRINYSRADYFSGRIYHSKLASGTECRIPSKHNLSNDRRLHQKLLQILSKHKDCAIFCFFRQFVSQFTLDRRCDQSLIAVGHNLFQNRCCVWIIPADHFLFQITENFLFRCFNLNTQEFFFFSTVECQHTVSGYFADRFCKIIIHLVYRFCFFIFCSRNQRTLFERQIADPLSVICLI